MRTLKLTICSEIYHNSAPQRKGKEQILKYVVRIIIYILLRLGPTIFEICLQRLGKPRNISIIPTSFQTRYQSLDLLNKIGWEVTTQLHHKRNTDAKTNSCQCFRNVGYTCFQGYLPVRPVKENIPVWLVMWFQSPGVPSSSKRSFRPCLTTFKRFTIIWRLSSLNSNWKC